MLLGDMLVESKGEIVARWVDAVLASYPEDAARIFKNGKDQFANPVGCAVKDSLWDVYALLFETEESDKVAAAIEYMVRIRAVQDFAPSAAVAAPFLLKQVVRDFCRAEKVADLEGWQVFEAKADFLARTMFDLYMGCRERLYKTQLEEYKRGNIVMTEGGCCPSRLMGKDSADKAGPTFLSNHDAR
jgi:hypothetical protein